MFFKQSINPLEDIRKAKSYAGNILEWMSSAFLSTMILILLIITPSSIILFGRYAYTHLLRPRRPASATFTPVTGAAAVSGLHTQTAPSLPLALLPADSAMKSVEHTTAHSPRNSKVIEFYESNKKK